MKKAMKMISVTKELPEFIAKIEEEAAAHGKSSQIYIAEQSDGMRQVFIRMHKGIIAELENIKSLRE